MGSRATLDSRDLRVHEDTGDPLDPLDRLESRDLLVPEDLRVRWETLELQGSKEMLESLVGGVLG